MINVQFAQSDAPLLCIWPSPVSFLSKINQFSDFKLELECIWPCAVFFLSLINVGHVTFYGSPEDLNSFPSKDQSLVNDQYAVCTIGCASSLHLTLCCLFPVPDKSDQWLPIRIGFHFTLCCLFHVPYQSVLWLPIRIQSEFSLFYPFLLNIIVCMQTSTMFLLSFLRRLETNLILILEIFSFYVITHSLQKQKHFQRFVPIPWLFYTRMT